MAKFDSATAMTRALANFLCGRDFAGLGQPGWLRTLVRAADWVPRRPRERVFAWMGAQEGIAPRDIARADAAQVAEWLCSLYPSRRYPAVAIGSSNGALLHLYAALGIPWLPQTFLNLVAQGDVDADDPARAMHAGMETARAYLRANPGIDLHRLHDPNQDRLMLGLITYFRAKFTRLPSAYVRFLERSLAPGGTVLLVECDQQWPTTRLGDRHVFQFGAIGGATPEDYFEGSERAAALLRRHGSAFAHWQPPPTDGRSPEAEWGFAPALRRSVLDLAATRGWRVLRLRFAAPETPSALVAEFHRDWYRRRGLPSQRLLLESFIVQEPYWALRTASVPFWMVFNMQPSLEHVHRYLDACADDPYDELLAMLFAHGADSIGLPPVHAWQQLLARAGGRGEFLGLRARTYPAHFAHLARYSQALRTAVPRHHALPEPLALEEVERYLRRHGPAHGVGVDELAAGAGERALAGANGGGR